MRNTLGNEKKLQERLEIIEYGMNNVPEELLAFIDENPNIREDYLIHAKENPINLRSLFYLNYSLGENLDNCFGYYLNWLKNYSKQYDPKNGYGWFELFDVLAIGICYKPRLNDFKEYIIDLINKTNIKDDYLLNEFYFYLFEKKISNPTSYKIKYAEKIFKEKNADIIRIILNSEWYNFHKEAYWYNADKADNNIYEGYWAFDIAAIAKILGIDDSKLKDVPYYPYDLVHYCD